MHVSRTRRSVLHAAPQSRDPHEPDILWAPAQQRSISCRAASGARELSRLLRPAEQKHALLAEHVPEPPGCAKPQWPAVKVERDRAFHLDVDLTAELHEILDGAKMDVRRVVPGGGQVFGARHMAADQ